MNKQIPTCAHVRLRPRLPATPQRQTDRPQSLRIARSLDKAIAVTVIASILAGASLMFGQPAHVARSQGDVPPVSVDNGLAPAAPAVSAAQSPRAFLPVVQSAPSTDGSVAANFPVVFVQRKINDNGSIYGSRAINAKDQPGVGAHSRVRPAAPGKLIIREVNGAMRVLVDGSKPTATSLNLIDVNGPDVSYDGKTIVFAGLPNGDYPTAPASNTNAWRIYAIKVDGTGLKQLTHSDLVINLAAAGLPTSLEGYDDYDPAWLPDGRIVFASTRYPSYGQYSGVRASNLYVINADGSAIHRITAERNGADRPVVNPTNGRILFSRWWRNHRFPLNDMNTVEAPDGGFSQKDGLSAERNVQLDGGNDTADALWRNAWQATEINPDGTGLKLFSGILRDEGANHVYGGAFLPNGDFVANYFPMFNMTEASGFGGLRLYKRGGVPHTPLMGITDGNGEYVSCSDPDANGLCSYGIYKGTYYTEPEVMPDGRLMVSMAKDIGQDYGLYIINVDGTGRKLYYDNPGTTEIRAKLVRPRTLPPIVKDTITQVSNILPPPALGPFDLDGTFTFDELNVYANGPVDMDIVNAPAVGSAQKIRFFIDHQRAVEGSFPTKDWPVLLAEMPVSPQGAVRNSAAPANVPLFEQLRDAKGKVPLTSGPGGEGYDGNGAAHVAGMNYGRPGEVVQCVGCHAGHSMIPVPANAADALFSNIAPGAQVSVSSARDANYVNGVNDRRVRLGEIWRYWTSAPGQADGQWVELQFPVPVIVRTVRLYNPRQGDEANSTLQVQGSTVKLFNNGAPVSTQVTNATAAATATTGLLSVDGTDVAFSDVTATSVRVEINGMSGTFYGTKVASLAEIEVIAAVAP